MKRKVLFFLLLLTIIPNIHAQTDLAPSSKSAILMDFSTGEVLYAKNENAPLPPASMTKIMSMLLIMEEIEANNLHFDDYVTISKNASSMGGSQLFLQENEKYQVKELLKGIAVASGNDVAVTKKQLYF